MPRIIENRATDAITLAQAQEALASRAFNPADEDSLDHAAQLLARLAADRGFLGDLMVAQLRDRHRDMAVESGYGPQAIVLSPLRNGCFLRANIWPSEQESCFHASGAKSFVYGVPHDHNFSFLTAGYFGPGYQSDYYEYD
ncbi:hypothetical protein [Qipengyuania marisflavi]|uniref:hypothetical protein n=1 Tax=Qipengyuania marisflavi TaxID=2486356 RepID=UPI001656D739|nr:hypothetical protein [Qipengyuania marisflavi]